MKILVTGGAGFIGSHLVEALVRDGAAVRVLDDLSTGSLEHLAAVRDAMEFLPGSVTDLATVQRAMQGVEAVVHEAALRAVPQSLDDPVLCNEVNVGGTLNVLVAARDARVRRVVVASSSAVYGDVPVYPVTEDHPLQPASPYAVSKLIGEQYAQLFRRLYGLEVVCLRYFNVFGPRMEAESDYAMAVPRFIASMLREEPPPVFGDGRQTRDFLFIDDVVCATRQALRVRDIGPGLFNIGSGRGRSILELIEILSELLQVRVAPRYLPAKPGEPRRTLAGIARARQRLGFEPQIGFREGLLRTIAWFRPRVRPRVPGSVEVAP